MSLISHTAEAPTSRAWLDGGATVALHAHKQPQLVYVSAGVLHVQTSEGGFVVSADRAAWLPPGTGHEHRFYGSSVLRTVGFSSDNAPISGAEPQVIAVSPLLRQLLIACTDGGLTPGEDNRLRAVIADQVRRMPQRPIVLPEARDPRLRDACDLVAERLEQPIGLLELARAVNVSGRTLSRLFREQLGMTYPQWRTNLRVLHAMVHLAGGQSVTRAGQLCGWATTSAFVDTFRRVSGQTPGAFAAGSTSQASQISGGQSFR